MPDHTTEPTKRCSKCGEVKPHSAFRRDKARRDGFDSRCSACRNVYMQKYYKQNREKIGEYRAQNPDKARLHSRTYSAANPDKSKELRRRRRARKASAEGTHTIDDMRRQYKAQRGKCWWCGKKVKWGDRHDDHLIPLVKGGSNWPSNMVVSCAFCNLSKGAKMPADFAGRLF